MIEAFSKSMTWSLDHAWFAILVNQDGQIIAGRIMFQIPKPTHSCEIGCDTSILGICVLITSTFAKIVYI